MLFEFEDLIDGYSVECTLIHFAAGGYVAGEYVPGNPIEVNVSAAIVPVSQSKIYQSGGQLTGEDRTMFILAEYDDIDLEHGKWYVQHNKKKYKVEASGQYGEDYADFNQYTLRRVDKFDV